MCVVVIMLYAVKEQDAHRRKVSAKLQHRAGGDTLDDDYISDNNISTDDESNKRKRQKHKHKY